MNRGLLLACIGLAACQTTEPSDSGSPFLVSNPTSRPALQGVLPAGSSVEGSVVYVSLPTGTIPDGLSAIILNPRTGQSVGAELIDGGLDPVEIAALAGDTLDIVVSTSNGGHEHFTVTVPIRARPKVVRTEPSPHKRDVPLNASIIVVFSEPIEAASLSGTTLRLERAGTAIPGQISFQDGTHASAVFTPSSALAPLSEHDLLVTSGIRDLNGESLEAVTVPFTTAAEPSVGELQVRIISFGDVLDQDGYVLAIAGLMNRSVGSNDSLKVQLPAGAYTVNLSGLATYCFPFGSQSVRVTIEPGATAALTFKVVCPRNEGLLVTFNTTFYGSGWPTLTFLLQVDDGGQVPISPNGYVSLSPIAPGKHTVGIKVPLFSGGAFCSGGFMGDGWNRKSVMVGPDGTGRVDFQLVCIP